MNEDQSVVIAAAPSGGATSSGRSPAPGELELVRAFINTLDRESGDDQVGDAPTLASWLVAHELAAPGIRLDHADLRRAHELRDDLCSLALANNGQAIDPAAVARLNGVAAVAPLALRFEADGESTLRPAAGGIDAAVARLLGIVYTSMAQGTWERLKACREDHCHWAFYDHSKNRSGAWCSMAVCGNRAKTRTYRRRRGAPGAASIQLVGGPSAT